jgi:hypothetical protein
MSETSDSPTTGLVRTPDAGIRRQSRVATWRRRFLNVRAVVAVVVLLSLIAPGVAAILDAAI